MSVKVPEGWRKLEDGEVIIDGDRLVDGDGNQHAEGFDYAGLPIKYMNHPQKRIWIRKLETPSLVWRKEPPDTPGVWAWRYTHWVSPNLGGIHSGYLDITSDDISTGAYKSKLKRQNTVHEFCRIADLPVIAEPTPPVQYRDVTIADLVNGPIECEVSDDGKEWKPVTCAGYVHEVPYPYYQKHSLGGVSAWKYARMPVDSAEKKPREWWVIIDKDYPNDRHSIDVYGCQQVDVGSRREQIHVREVLK